MEQFLTIKENKKAEIVVKKSRFIAEVFYIESEKEAEDILQTIKKREHSAKHHCFAYRVIENSLIQRMSDDGEPQGTAGSPMLAILQNKELVNVLVVVTRYFGGILLGTGGLVRAYSDATIMALDAAERKIVQKGAEISLEVDYSDFDALKYYLNNINGKIISSEYNNSIKNIVEIPISYSDTFILNYQKLPFRIKSSKKVREKYVDI